MHPLIYTNLTDASIFAAACTIWLVPEGLGMNRQMAKASRKTASVLGHRSLGILVGLQWTGLTLNFWLG